MTFPIVGFAWSPNNRIDDIDFFHSSAVRRGVARVLSTRWLGGAGTYHLMLSFQVPLFSAASRSSRRRVMFCCLNGGM